MTPEKIIEALDACASIINCFEHDPPKRCDSTCRIMMTRVRLAHLLWMTQEAKSFCNPAVPFLSKANRWLGFIQGALWQEGIVSIEQMKQLNKPGDE